MREIWKDITDYEGLYQVSNLGRIKSLKRETTYIYKRGGTHTISEKIIKQFKSKKGYLNCFLYKDGKRKTYKVHRLVAQAFLGESDLTVNHKDENKGNNKISNLEYMTNKDNIRYSRAKKVIGTNILTKDQLFFDAVIDVEKMGFKNSYVSRCCLGKRKTYKGYKWEYVEEEENE